MLVNNRTLLFWLLAGFIISSDNLECRPLLYQSQNRRQLWTCKFKQNKPFPCRSSASLSNEPLLSKQRCKDVFKLSDDAPLKRKKRSFTELSFFRWFALRCIPSAPARHPQMWPGPTQSAALQFCRVGEHSAYSSHKSRHYPGISRKHRRGSERGGGASGLARESRYAKNNSIVRERTTNTAAGSHTLTSTH